MCYRPFLCLLPLAGDEEVYWANLEGRDPPQTAYKPCMANIAPRAKVSWVPARSNTQQPPLTGPVSDRKEENTQGSSIAG